MEKSNVPRNQKPVRRMTFRRPNADLTKFMKKRREKRQERRTRSRHKGSGGQANFYWSPAEGYKVGSNGGLVRIHPKVHYRTKKERRAMNAIVREGRRIAAERDKAKGLSK